MHSIRSKFTFLQAHLDARTVGYSFEIENVVIFTFISLITRVNCPATEEDAFDILFKKKI